MCRKTIYLVSLTLLMGACRTWRMENTAWKEAEEKARKLQGDVENYRDEQERLLNELAKVQQELEAERARSKSMDELVERSSARLNSVEASLLTREAVVVESGRRIEQLEQQRDSLQERVSSLQNSLHSTEKTNNISSQEIDELRNELQRRDLALVPESFRTVDAILSRLPFGDVAFNTPKHMYVGDTTEVSLKISLTAGVEELKRRLVERALQRDETITAEKVRVHSLMRASLTGSNGFSVTPLDNLEDKPVPSSGVQQWLWEVEAKKAGIQRLHLTLSALLEVEGKERPFPVETFSETIEVKVSKERVTKGFIADNWQWLWATVVAPVAVALWEGLKKLRSKRRESLIIQP